MFWNRKKESKSGGTEDWLKDVDIAYTKSFQCGNVQALEPYCTRACLVRLAERVRLGGKEYAGLDRYKHVTWKAEDPDTQLQWIKEVCYDHVKVSRGVVVPVGDDYHERWLITLDTQSRLVAEIRRIS